MASGTFLPILGMFLLVFSVRGWLKYTRPIECYYVQRQQLKFLWKILHLDDMAPQKIVLLHGKLNPKYSRGRGGRQRTYNQCIKDALGNFGVTMAQCIDMERQDWMQSSKEPD